MHAGDIHIALVTLVGVAMMFGIFRIGVPLMYGLSPLTGKELFPKKAAKR